MRRRLDYVRRRGREMGWR
jgi:hypothetical protein